MRKNTTRFYKIDLQYHKNCYELKELIREFLPPETFFIQNDSVTAGNPDSPKNSEPALTPETETVHIALPDPEMDRDRAKRFLFDALQASTGYRPEWGILTGVRPTKMVNEKMTLGGMTEDAVRNMLEQEYYLSAEKADLVLETCRNQRFLTSVSGKDTVGIYIGIPFCPTRCLYCSFPSNPADTEMMEPYLEALEKEISAVGRKLSELGVPAESVYLGGGTPTTLEADQCDRLLQHVRNRFDLSQMKEFCVEAGRPDTITREKLEILKKHGVDRISINPQTMNEKTLRRIGRDHTADQIREAFALAEDVGIPMVNADIIAGLPGEDEQDFRHTLEEVLALHPSNITVHTLAVKRASRLKEMDSHYHYERGRDVGNMVSDARRLLREKGYFPYYMYRQKHMTGNYENVSYARPGTESIYNIRIMDEHQTIIALGAGGISKAYYDPFNRLERVPNVSNYRIYMERIDEMIERKEKKLYRPFQDDTDKKTGSR